MTVRRLLSEVLRLRFNGYLQGSYSQNFNSPSNRINQLRIFDVNSNEFRPNVVQLQVERPLNIGGSTLDQLGFRVKFNAGRNSDFIGGMNLSTWADFQEVYVNYMAPLGHGLELAIGQFNALVGYEQVGNPYSPNYSRSYLYLGQPFTTGGISATYEFNKQVSLSIRALSYINAAQAGIHHDPMVEYLLMVNPSERVKIMLYGLFGPRVGAPGTPGGMLMLTGGYASWQLATQTWAVVEAYYANQANSSMISSGQNARWEGMAAYLFHDFTNKWGMRLRGEIFEDAGGLVTCQGTTAYQPRANVCFGATSGAPSAAIAQTLWEFTLTLEYRPLPSLRTRLEYRYDKSDHNVFQLGDRATSYQPTLSLDFVYLF
ncbi:MAG: outer membrane beta-barrel protein [Nitrospira sp.]